MSREKRRGSRVLLAGLGGYALGAATVLFVLWVYGMPGSGGLAGRAGWQPGAAPAPGPPGAQPWPPGAPAQPPPAPDLGGTPPEAAPPETAPPGAAPPGMAPPGATPPNPAPGAGAGIPAPSPQTGAEEIAGLRRRNLLLPVQGLRREQLVDSFSDSRAGHIHEAIDIMAARGTPVLAVEGGRIAKLFFSRQGGNTVYEFDPGETYAYYYAHLDRYADGLHEGAALQRGQVIGYVGTTGNAPPNTPHLHFAIFRLNPDKHWWEGTAVNPFKVLAQ